MSEAVFILLLIALGLVIYFTNKKTSVAKSATQTKADIIKGYKNRMDLELGAYVTEPKVLLQKKTALIKVIADELNRNIFFDKDEVKDLVQDLILYEVKGS